MNRLQNSLLLNAVFSGISGFTLILFHGSIARLFGTENSTVFWVIGALLLFFTLTIILEIMKQRPLAVLWIIAQDMIWVIGSIILIAINPFGITFAGNVIIAVVALIVLLMAVNQSRAMSGLDDKDNTGIKVLHFERPVEAKIADVWNVISDVGNYHDVAPNIDKAEILSGDGEGMVRKCSHGNDSWTETCTAWNEEKSYTFKVNTSEPDFPFPLNHMEGRWTLEKIDNQTTNILIDFEMKYSRKIYNVILHPLLKNRFGKSVEELLDNWQRLLQKTKIHERRNVG